MGLACLCLARHWLSYRDVTECPQGEKEVGQLHGERSGKPFWLRGEVEISNTDWVKIGYDMLIGNKIRMAEKTG